MIESKTEKELNQIARDLHAGRIYTDLHIPEHEAMGLIMVFLPLGFMEKGAREELLNDEPGLLYEYLDEANPRSVNGMPTFMSMQILNKKDAEKVLDKTRKLDDAISEALGENDEEKTEEDDDGEREEGSTLGRTERSPGT
jgi:hypothetical protein